MLVNEPPVTVEQTFNCTPQKLWIAITDLDEMKKWFFENIPEFIPELGFKTQFMIENEGRQFLHLWEITDVTPKEKLTFNWKFKDYEGDSFVSFELSEKGSQTLLKLTVTVTEDFPDTIPEFKRESCLGGWKYFINERLNNYLKS